MRWNLIEVPFHDTSWNADILGVGAVIKEQIFAEILEAALAVEAFQAWS
jgi:hypothetical protein